MKINNLNNSLRTFADSVDYLKAIAISLPISLAVHIIPKILTKMRRNKDLVFRDEVLDRKNKKLNSLFDNYKSGKGIKNTPKERDEYYNTLKDVFNDVIIYFRTQEFEGEKTVYSTTIAPFIGFLRIILIKDIYILAGQDLGADRIGFELVYEPDPLKAEDIARDPFRTKIYTHKWPDHGFRVSTIGIREANELIDDTFYFLAQNPQYLSIRV